MSAKDCREFADECVGLGKDRSQRTGAQIFLQKARKWLWAAARSDCDTGVPGYLLRAVEGLASLTVIAAPAPTIRADELVGH